MPRLNRIMSGVVLAGAFFTIGATVPAPTAVEPPPVCIGCAEGCTSGEGCRAFEKCDEGACTATVQTKNCKNDTVIET